MITSIRLLKFRKLNWNLQVHVNNIHGSQMAAKITGKFTIEGHTFRFNAIAFGRIGGQNVGAKISKTTEKAIKKTRL